MIPSVYVQIEDIPDLIEKGKLNKGQILPQLLEYCATVLYQNINLPSSIDVSGRVYLALYVNSFSEKRAAKKLDIIGKQIFNTYCFDALGTLIKIKNQRGKHERI